MIKSRRRGKVVDVRREKKGLSSIREINQYINCCCWLVKHWQILKWTHEYLPNQAFKTPSLMPPFPIFQTKQSLSPHPSSLSSFQTKYKSYLHKFIKKIIIDYEIIEEYKVLTNTTYLWLTMVYKLKLKFNMMK